MTVYITVNVKKLILSSDERPSTPRTEKALFLSYFMFFGLIFACDFLNIEVLRSYIKKCKIHTWLVYKIVFYVYLFYYIIVKIYLH